jgi:hypothetical protein
MEVVMKYKINCVGNEKIPIIKLVRLFTAFGLKESKDLTEENILPSIGFNYRFTLIVDEVQLGRYLIHKELGHLMSNTAEVDSIEEISPLTGIDISGDN